MEGDAMKLRKKSWWLFLCLAMVTVLAVSTVNQAMGANPVETRTQVQTQVEQQPPAKTETPDVTYIIFLYALILAFVILVPTLMDICKAYRSQNTNRQLIINKLVEAAGKDKLDMEELKALIEAASTGPPGISGMSRSLMAYAVIIILGLAVFHLLAFCNCGAKSEALKIVNNIMGMLAATLASITGFYFGGKSAEGKVKEKEEKPAKTGKGGAGGAPTPETGAGP
jgi:uncharacterized membrane protein